MDSSILRRNNKVETLALLKFYSSLTFYAANSSCTLLLMQIYILLTHATFEQVVAIANLRHRGYYFKGGGRDEDKLSFAYLKINCQLNFVKLWVTCDQFLTSLDPKRQHLEKLTLKDLHGIKWFQNLKKIKNKKMFILWEHQCNRWSRKVWRESIELISSLTHMKNHLVVGKPSSTMMIFQQQVLSFFFALSCGFKF